MLLNVVSDHLFQPFRINKEIDQRKHYRLDLDPRFPLAVRLLSFSTLADPLRFNWHERLEIFVAAAGRGSFRMGDRVINFTAGDILVVDNLKLHGLVDYQGPQRLGVVINFMPELVCGPVSHPCDAVYLVPFYSRPPEFDPIVRPKDRAFTEVHAALGKMLQCYFSDSMLSPVRQAGCKAHLLDALYHLAGHFGPVDSKMSDWDIRRRQSLQFGRLYEHLRENYSEAISVSEAAAMVGMTEFRFMKFFKKATGMTFVTYLTHLRLSQAYRLLIETDLSIAEIAVSVGFSDQSYFDRRFRSAYNQPPREVRNSAVLSK
ncbi:MAG TPA: AraC family transcriptional regulator [Bryobacteraceae bacterium]|nr:AraC family transcriptional regulator [Bryobacteraceae bacterium]